MKEFSKEDIERMANGDVVSSRALVRRICISQPVVLLEGCRAILRSRVEVDSVCKDVDFITDAEYAPYLCYERADAFLIGMLSLAMRERCDIYCEAPVTKELLHQLRTELLPVLCKYDQALYSVQIYAETSDETLPSAGKIGTGCSCGVDSLYAIRSLAEDLDYGLDYLTINNVGAYTHSGRASLQRYRDNVENARCFAEESGYKLIVTDSNFSEVFPQNHLRTHLYSSVFAIYALRKLWKRYYYASSGYDLEDCFKLTNNHLHDAAAYDLVALSAFSIPSLRICNQGLHKARFEKIRAVADYVPAWRYLNVCLKQGKGACNKCPKCLRTLWILDALGKLDNFKEIFDVQYYREHRDTYLKQLYRARLEGVHMIDEAYEILQNQITKEMRKQVERELRRQRPGLIRKVIRKVKKAVKFLQGHP